MKRKIIKIDENLCNGCGVCIPDCPEGALKMIDGKARLVSDLFCDGLGACIGRCPQGAIAIEEREAEAYNEKRVMTEQIIPKGTNTIIEHLKHLDNHGETTFLNEALAVLQEKNIPVPKYKKETAGCCGDFSPAEKPETESAAKQGSIKSELNQWPVQLHLVNPSAGFFDNCDLLISADCVPYAYGAFHSEFLKDKKIITFCPKLDHSSDQYIDKLTDLFTQHKINSVTIVRMEVPCCGGTSMIAKQSIEKSGKNVDYKEVVIGIGGNILS